MTLRKTTYLTPKAPDLDGFSEGLQLMAAKPKRLPAEQLVDAHYETIKAALANGYSFVEMGQACARNHIKVNAKQIKLAFEANTAALELETAALAARKVQSQTNRRLAAVKAKSQKPTNRKPQRLQPIVPNELGLYRAIDLQLRYGIGKSHVYSRLKPLGIATTLHHQFAYVTAEDVKLLDALHAHLQTRGTIAAFVSQQLVKACFQPRLATLPAV